MATDVRKLSPNAQKIFENLKPYFPIGPFKEDQWKAEGKVFSNGWYDLRKSADREKLMKWEERMLGYSVVIQAGIHRDNRDGQGNRNQLQPNGQLGWMKGFTRRRFPRSIQHTVELYLLLQDLDSQIETMDLVDGYDDSVNP